MERIEQILVYIMVFYLFELILVFPFPVKETKNFNTPPLKSKSINITKNDRILIVSPHPDDAALSSSGIIKKALNKGAKVKIVYITCGSHNTDTMVKDTLVHAPTPISGILLGETRHKEAVNAMESLGLKQSDLIFLGFPDFGTLKMWVDYFNKAPYFSGITMHNRTFYQFVYRKKVLFTAENELKLLEDVISEFKPTKIIYTPTIDLNSDHRATGLFVDAALFDLRNKIHPETFQYFMHAEDWPIPQKYEPNLYLGAPNFIKNISGQWFISYLSKNEEEIKRRAIECHKSQVASKPNFMYSLIRKNELFFRETEKTNSFMPLWTDKEMEKLKISPSVSSVYIGEGKNYISYKIILKKGFGDFTKLYIFVYPEETDNKFGDTPKYRIVITHTIKHRINVLFENNGKIILHKKEDLKAQRGNLTLRVDLNKKYLKNTVAFFSAAQLEQANLRMSETPWWNISLENNNKK